MEGCRSIAFSSPSGIARFARPSSEVPSRASGCGPATRRSKVFSKVSNGESVKQGTMGSSFHFGAGSVPLGLPRFSPELTPLARTPLLPRMWGSRGTRVSGVNSGEKRGSPHGLMAAPK